jgi:hypothetical protein
MARRASSGIHSGVIVGAAAALVLAFIGGKMLLGGESAAKPDGTPLDMETFEQHANSLRGNEYVVEGTVDGQLHWHPDRGQVISLRVDDAGTSRFLAIEIPAEFSTQNIEREQRYAFLVRVRDGGIAVAREISRL